MSLRTQFKSLLESELMEGLVDKTISLKIYRYAVGQTEETIEDLDRKYARSYIGYKGEPAIIDCFLKNDDGKMIIRFFKHPGILVRCPLV